MRSIGRSLAALLLVATCARAQQIAPNQVACYTLAELNSFITLPDFHNGQPGCCSDCIPGTSPCIGGAPTRGSLTVLEDGLWTCCSCTGATTVTTSTTTTSTTLLPGIFTAGPEDAFGPGTGPIEGHDYFSLSGSGQDTYNRTAIYLPFAMTVKAIDCVLRDVVAPATGMTLTLYKNGSPTSLTTTVGTPAMPGSPGDHHRVTGSVSFTAGDTAAWLALPDDPDGDVSFSPVLVYTAPGNNRLDVPGTEGTSAGDASSFVSYSPMGGLGVGATVVNGVGTYGRDEHSVGGGLPFDATITGMTLRVSEALYSYPEVTRTMTMRQGFADVGTALSVAVDTHGIQAESIAVPQLISSNLDGLGRISVAVRPNLTSSTAVGENLQYAVGYTATNVGDAGASYVDAESILCCVGCPDCPGVGAAIPWPVAGTFKYFRVYFPEVTDTSWLIHLIINGTTVDTLTSTAGSYAESSGAHSVVVDDAVEVDWEQTGGGLSSFGRASVLLGFQPSP